MKPAGNGNPLSRCWCERPTTINITGVAHRAAGAGCTKVSAAALRAGKKCLLTSPFIGLARKVFSDGNFRIGVVVSGRYARAMFVSGQPGARQCRVAVPKSASMNLFLNTTLNVSQPGYPSIGSDQPSLRILVTGQSEVDVDLQVQ